MPGFSINIAPDDSTCHVPIDTAASYNGPLLSNTSEYSRDYRFLLTPNTKNQIFNDEMAMTCRSIDRPTYKTTPIKIYNGADHIKRPGRIAYDPITIEFNERVASNSTISINDYFYQWWRSYVVHSDDVRISTSFLGFTKNTVTIAMLGGDGRDIWRYKLFDVWPSEVEPSKVSYSNDDVGKCSIVLNYNYFIEF